MLYNFIPRVFIFLELSNKFKTVYGVKCAMTCHTLDRGRVLPIVYHIFKSNNLSLFNNSDFHENILFLATGKKSVIVSIFDLSLIYRCHVFDPLDNFKLTLERNIHFIWIGSLLKHYLIDLIILENKKGHQSFELEV
jgi:hypothetical protein